MANVGSGISRLLIDQSGDPITDDNSNALKVKLVGSDTINANIGDIDVEFNGTAASVGADDVDSGTLRITLANDDPAVASLDEIESAIENIEGTVGVDGETGPPRCISIGGTSGLGAIQEIAVDSAGHLQVDVLGDALTSLQLLDDVIYADDADFTLDSSKGIVIMGYQGSQNIDSGDVGAIKLNSTGHQLVSLGTEVVVTNGSGYTQPISGTVTANAGTNLNTSALSTHAKQDTMITHLSEIEGAVETIEGAVSGSEMQVDIVSSPELTVNLGSTDNGVLDAMAASLALLDNSIASGNELQVDIVAALPAGDNNIGNVDIASSVALNVNSHAVTNAGTFEVQSNVDDTVYTENDDWAEGSSKHILVGGVNHSNTIASDDTAPIRLKSNGSIYVAQESSYRIISSGSIGHDITGGADGVTVVSSAGIDVVLGGDVACKKIDIQAQTDNTGLISVGFTGVDATEATGTGVILYAGDTYSLEIDNLNLIYIDSTVSGEGVRYTYFT
jgi:hypothetical protein